MRQFDMGTKKEKEGQNQWQRAVAILELLWVNAGQRIKFDWLAIVAI